MRPDGEPVTLAWFLLLFLLVPVVSFSPGFLLVRRLRRWDPLEKLAASVAASIVLVYLTAFAIYNTLLPWNLAWVYTALSLAALAVCRREARRLFAVPQVKRVVLLFAALFAWNLLMLAAIRNYVGAFWGPDWFEHYDRAIFFLERGPDYHEFLDTYYLPARPPLMNLYSTFFLAHAGPAFANFQLTFAFLNLLPFVPLVLVTRLMVRGATRYAALVATLLALNPMFVHNAQFTWTKAGVGFFVALALWFYVVAWRRQDPVRMAIAFFSLAAGTLAHYSGGPYLVILGLHYLCCVFWWRRNRVRELAALALPGAALLATWFGYSVSAYGVKETFAANSSVIDSGRLGFADNLAKIGWNIVNTLVPHLTRGFWVERNEDTFRRIVDNAFYLYQVNLPFAFGIAGCFLVLFLLARTIAARPPAAARGERRFWLAFALLAVVLSIAVVGPPDDYGVAHIGLQPLVQIGLAWLAVSLPAVPRMLRGVAVAGLAVDFVLGIAMHLYMETSVEEWASDYNMELKTKMGVVFLGDWIPGWALPIQWVVWALAAVLIVRTYRLLARLPEAGGSGQSGHFGKPLACLSANSFSPAE